MKDYDAYLFDWDGTVAQTLAMWLSIVQETLRAYGIDADDKDVVRKVFGRTKVGLLELGVPEADFVNVFQKWDKQAQAAIVKVPLYPGFRDAAQALRQRDKHLAVITATVRPTLHLALTAHGLADTFNAIVAGGEAEDKPNPDGLLQALERLDVPKERAIMLGDSEKDIRAAHNAGIDSVLFYPDGHELFHVLADLQMDKPTHTINSWQEFIDRVQ